MFGYGKQRRGCTQTRYSPQIAWNYTDKVFVNKVVNFLNKKIDAQLFNRIKISQSKNEFLSGIGSLPYVIQRRLYLYLYE